MSRLSHPADHERARLLAAEAIDFPLEPADAAWLDEHLSGCEECAGVAAEHRALRDELRALPVPVPPRDLWARTAAALDAVDAKSGRPARGTATGTSRRAPGFFGGMSLSMLSSGVAVGAVVLIVAASITSSGGPTKPHGPEFALASATPSNGPTSATVANVVRPVAVSGGQVVWVVEDQNGATRITTSSVCMNSSDKTCAVTDVTTGQTLYDLNDPNATVAAVNGSGNRVAVNTGPSLVVVSVHNSNAASASPSPSPSNTPSVSPSPTATSPASPTASPKASATPRITFATKSPAASLTQTPTPTVTAPPATPSPTTSATATATPASTASTATPSPTPGASATISPAASSPVPILEGYEVVGTTSFSPDGAWLAFSAQPLDGSTGPDVFVWHDGDEHATRVTNSHAAYFSSWSGGQILFTEFEHPSTDGPQVSPGVPSAASSAASSTASATASSTTSAAAGTDFLPVSYLVDPATHAGIRYDRAMFLPSIDPTRRYITYWAGTVSYDPEAHAWSAVRGDLYFDLTSSVGGTPVRFVEDLPLPQVLPSSSASPSPSASPAATGTLAPTAPVATGSPSPSASASPSLPLRPQLLPIVKDLGGVTRWQIRWDSYGKALVIWVADTDGSSDGELGVFAIDDTTGTVSTDEPLLKAPADASFQVTADQVIYTGQGDDGKTKTFFVSLPKVALPTTSATPAPSGSVDDNNKGGGH